LILQGEALAETPYRRDAIPPGKRESSGKTAKEILDLRSFRFASGQQQADTRFDDHQAKWKSISEAEAPAKRNEPVLGGYEIIQDA
jgi:hypothetical protein